jgi:hypothetical protein
MLLLACVIYVPGLQKAFGTFIVTWTDWLTALAVASSVVPLLEMIKFAQRRSKGGFS